MIKLQQTSENIADIKKKNDRTNQEKKRKETLNQKNTISPHQCSPKVVKYICQTPFHVCIQVQLGPGDIWKMKEKQQPILSKD